MKNFKFGAMSILLLSAVAAQAQEVAPQTKTFRDLVIQGGWAMIPLGILSLAMFYFIVQNIISLSEKNLLHAEKMPDFLKMMVKGDTLKALEVCRENPTMFSLIFGAGLERCLDDEKPDFSKVKESVEEATVEQVTMLMKPIDYLSIIGAIAPMLGLLGTVSGMIKAFNTMGSTGMGKPELLAGNIGEALITTATGLIIAIPAMLFYFYFKKGFHKTIASLGRNLGFLFDALEKGKMPAAFRDLSEFRQNKKEQVTAAFNDSKDIKNIKLS